MSVTPFAGDRNHMKKSKHRKKDIPAMAMVPRIFLDSSKRLIREASGALSFNVAAFQTISHDSLRREVGQSFKDAGDIASEGNYNLAPSTDFRTFANDMIRMLPRVDMSDSAIESLLRILAQYKFHSNELHGAKTWPDSSGFPGYDIAQHRAVVRYGNVELRVVENFLLEPERLRKALEGVMENYSDETKMYENASLIEKLVHNDIDFNIRRLMTNAGFYLRGDSASAWDTLKEWVERYISALRHSHLSWHNEHSLHYLKIQKALNAIYGVVPQYVQTPNRKRIYKNIAGRDVLFVSPLAHIVNKQVELGRLGELYKNYEVPHFSLRAIPAWVSTWPNRPHADWSETFRRMCDSVDTAYRERPFDVFMSACGCYGLPISDYVRSRYRCSTLYIGHRAHTLFGLFPGQSDTSINRKMWERGDLSRYQNMDRIDRGRYI